MTAFDQLTHHGQVKRLRHAALAALDHYDLEVARLSLIQHAYNTLFEIRTPDGTRYALRVNGASQRSLGEIRAEMAWLHALAHETDLHVPEPLPTRAGGLVTTVEATGVPEPRHVAIFSWMDGRHQRHAPSPALVRRMGATLATLHIHAETFQLPADASLKRMDAVWPFGTPDKIYGADHEWFPPERRALFQQAAEVVSSTLERVYQAPDGLRILHADLHLGNVKVQAGQLRVFDFDDCALGLPVHDIAISLYYLQYAPNFPTNRAAFLEGYQQVRPLPDFEPLETLIAARELAVMNYLLQSSNPQLQQATPFMLQHATRRLQAWLGV